MKIMVEQTDDRDTLGFQFSGASNIYKINMLANEGPKAWAEGLRLLAEQFEKSTQ